MIIFQDPYDLGFKNFISATTLIFIKYEFKKIYYKQKYETFFFNNYETNI